MERDDDITSSNKVKAIGLFLLGEDQMLHNIKPKQDDTNQKPLGNLKIIVSSLLRRSNVR